MGGRFASMAEACIDTEEAGSSLYLEHLLCGANYASPAQLQQYAE